MQFSIREGLEMEFETFEERDLVHVEGNRRICTVVAVHFREPKYKVQFGPEEGNVRRVMSNELALVQKYTPPASSPAFVLTRGR